MLEFTVCRIFTAQTVRYYHLSNNTLPQVTNMEWAHQHLCSTCTWLPLLPLWHSLVHIFWARNVLESSLLVCMVGQRTFVQYSACPCKARHQCLMTSPLAYLRDRFLCSFCSLFLQHSLRLFPPMDWPSATMWMTLNFSCLIRWWPFLFRFLHAWRMSWLS